MASFSRTNEFREAEFIEADLSGARFRSSDLTGVVMREVDIQQADIDAPWLSDGDSYLLINGVNVIPLVEAELDRRFPGRSERRVTDPHALRAAWAKLEVCWDGALDRVATMPEGTVDTSIDNEWSFAQTLRHLVLATDMWLGKAVLGREQPFHRFGLTDNGTEVDPDGTIFAKDKPSYAEVLDARADRVALVQNFLATVTTDDLAVKHSNPHNPDEPETTLSCLHVILEEEWEHHRYAMRDLDSIAAGNQGVADAAPST